MVEQHPPRARCDRQPLPAGMDAVRDCHAHRHGSEVKQQSHNAMKQTIKRDRRLDPCASKNSFFSVTRIPNP